MLEIALFTPSSAPTAISSGALRLELCTSYSAGGLTPSLSTLLTTRASVGASVPINVMIRPRGGDFVYSSSEYETMKQELATLKASGAASGFVFGILTEAGQVDVERCSELVRLAAPLPCTFHRAIDCVPGGDLNRAVEEVISCGFSNLLTSGGAKSAVEGVERVKAMQEEFGSRISIILGGGIRSGNVGELKRRTGVPWVHSAAITVDEGEEVDGEEVRSMIKVLQNMNEES